MQAILILLQVHKPDFLLELHPPVRSKEIGQRAELGSTIPILNNFINAGR